MKKKKYGVHLPPYKVQPLTRLQAIKELTNWAFIRFRIRELWKYTQGDGIKVMILDTGWEHKDIKVEKARDFTGEGIPDKNGHGNWVAGCVHAAGGFLGKVPKCKLYVGKILSNTGEGAWMWMQQGLQWALEEEVDIINISAGGTYTGNAIQPILKKLADKGVLTICAAGNANNLLIFPASDVNTIAVGAITRKEQRAAFSNFGPRLIVMAPGVDLLGCYLNNGYAKLTGTSMASPETACIVALEKELRAMNLKEAVARFALTSKDMDKEGWDSKTGWGIVDPWKFLKIEEPDKKDFGWLLKLIIFIILYIYFGGLIPAAATITTLFKKKVIE